MPGFFFNLIQCPHCTKSNDLYWEAGDNPAAGDVPKKLKYTCAYCGQEAVYSRFKAFEPVKRSKDEWVRCEEA